MPTAKNHEFPNDFYDRNRLRIQRRIGRALRLAGRVVDLGCGNCELAQYLAQSWRQHVIGIDISDDAIPKDPHHDSGVDLRCISSNAEHLDFLTEGDTDAVVIKYALHEMTHPNKILREAYRILRPGGTILIVEFPRDSLAQELWDEDYFTPDQLHSMVEEAGFREVSVRLPFQSQIAWVRGWKPKLNSK
jgi:ubiquinone/menaquinone biosynthesis C-methylase UbiE